MTKDYSGPSIEAVRGSLAAVITEGLTPSSIAEHGHVLLELKLVVERLSTNDHADEDQREADYAQALTAVLDLAVIKERIPGRKHRRILKYVLPLESEYLGATIKDRRAAAGEHLTDGKKVKASTIRTYPEYEPTALDELARALTEMEAECRGEEKPQ
jgi:hypothetical protein